MLLQCLKNIMELTVWQVYSIVNLHIILVRLLPTMQSLALTRI